MLALVYDVVLTPLISLSNWNLEFVDAIVCEIGTAVRVRRSLSDGSWFKTWPIQSSLFVDKFL